MNDVGTQTFSPLHRKKMSAITIHLECFLEDKQFPLTQGTLLVYFILDLCSTQHC